ncbi:uncharacterized protein LOC122257671 [Penaeus japonicus]|uniref:uncharacterized protein LOC122257671 n=1 Tax=Penaeus japonicus TaxID=27405 RepID=UPI001C70E5DF|nr:uncharacterized protein LOC122257671 [Penaeus japonicus]
MSSLSRGSSPSRGSSLSRGSSPSRRTWSEHRDLSWLGVFPNLTHLYLIEVDVDTSTLPELEHLHTLVIEDGAGVMTHGNYDLRHLSHVEELYLTLGEETLPTDFVLLESDGLQYVEIAAPSASVNGLEPNFVNLQALYELNLVSCLWLAPDGRAGNHHESEPRSDALRPLPRVQAAAQGRHHPLGQRRRHLRILPALRHRLVLDPQCPGARVPASGLHPSRRPAGDGKGLHSRREDEIRAPSTSVKRDVHRLWNPPYWIVIFVRRSAMYHESVKTASLGCVWYPTRGHLSAEALATEALATEALATEALATEALATEALATEALATEALKTKALTTEALTTEALATEILARPLDTSGRQLLQKRT